MKKIASVIFIICFIMIYSNIAIAENYLEDNDIVQFNSDVIVDKEVNGNVVVINGNIDVNKRVKGDVVAINGSININNEVDGNVVALFGNVDVSNNGKINEDLIATGKITSKSNLINGIQASFELNMDSLSSTNFVTRIVVNIIFVGVFTILQLLFGLLIMRVFKNWFGEIWYDIEWNIGKRLGIGLLSYIPMIIISIILAIFVIPILIIIPLFIVFNILTCLSIGRSISKIISTSGTMISDFLVGLTSLFFIKIILMFYNGSNLIMYMVSYMLFCIIIDSYGLGVFIDTKIRRRKI